jgi:hypothetical protein
MTGHYRNDLRPRSLVKFVVAGDWGTVPGDSESDLNRLTILGRHVGIQCLSSLITTV